MIFRRVVYNLKRMEKQVINLNHNEQLLFQTLLQYKKDLGLTTVMRVAGGWVRDKIMGKQSHDIDIALDNMKGEDFVTRLKLHAQTRNEKISSFGVTKFNPELSKHLETATAKIHGHSIDFVNLRSETYNEDSRIPQVEMGTPLTDALRRDFTINALFYNIDSQTVEDWTQKGLSDLHDQLIRTPLPPLVTFKDDPLRVLRCFRFKARFNFKVHPEIYQSLSDPSISQALKTKVSKERIGIELAGMLRASHALLAIEEILRFNLWHIVFQVPQGSDLQDLNYINQIPRLSFQLLQRGLESLKQRGLRSQEWLLETEVKDKRKRYSSDDLQVMVPLCLLLLPYQGFRAPDGKKWMSLAEHITKNELKYSSKIAEFVQATVDLTQALESVLTAQNNFKLRVVKWLRQAEEKWEVALHCLAALRQVREEDGKVEMGPLELREWILNEKLQDSYLVKAFIDGNFLNKRGKKGPLIKVILENGAIWRVLHSQASELQFLQVLEKEPAFFENPTSYS